MQLINLFAKKSEQSQNIITIGTPSAPEALEKIFAHLRLIVPDARLIALFVNEYQKLSLLAAQEREIPFIKLYITLEEFIIKNKQPVVTKVYTTESLRQEVATIVPVDRLSDAFRLIFLSDSGRACLLATLGLPYILKPLSTTLGKDHLQSLLIAITRDTLFAGIQFDGQIVIYPPTFNQTVTNKSFKEVTSACNAIYERIYQQLTKTIGEKRAAELLTTYSNFIQQTYSFNIIVILFDILPKNVIASEKLGLLSRQDLERVINDKTMQLESAKKTLEEQIGQVQEQNQALENTKKSMLNIMEDLQQEKTLTEQAKAKDDAIINSIGDGMIAVDPLGKISVVNPVAVQLLELDLTVALGKLFTEAFHLSDEQGVLLPPDKNPIMITLQTGQRTMQTCLFIKKDQTKVSLGITATPIKQNEKILGSIGIIRDITKEKQVDRMKTEFISLASHQLRTPLSAIRWFSEMLLGGDAGELTPEQKDFAKNITDSTQRMIELVNSLLNVSRIESGRIMIDPQPTDLKELVDGLVTELQVKIKEREQNLIVSVHEGLPKINVDPKLIRQVYLNLLTNAIKYTPKKGEISVFISKKDDEVVSQVSDNGYGIPKAEQSKMFQKFFRATNIIKVETDGTGLGMYLLKSIIESSHGKIWFESNTKEESLPDGRHGTTFWFSLPMTGMVAKKGEVTLDS